MSEADRAVEVLQGIFQALTDISNAQKQIAGLLQTIQTEQHAAFSALVNKALPEMQSEIPPIAHGITALRSSGTRNRGLLHE